MNKEFVTYEEFGAVGDGKTNDFAAIYKAHVYANENKLPVKANDSATYYICEPLIDGEVKSIPIKTSVEWGSANFIIDDTTIKVGEETNAWRGTVIFVVLPDEPKYKIEDRETLEKIERLREMVNNSQNIVAFVGAGCSTEMGAIVPIFLK